MTAPEEWGSPLSMRSLVDRWLSRHAEPSPEALRAIEGLKPIVLVTGGSRGIGLELARRFARAGNNVAIAARHADAEAQATGTIARDYDVSALSINVDVTAPDAVQRVEADLHANGFYVDTLINCAGVGLSGPFVDHTSAQIEALIHLNVTALTRFTRELLPAMLARGRGGIINVASLGGLVPGPNQAAYYASKAYVVSLTRAIATEISGRGVRIMALSPGPVDTGFHQAMGAELSFYRQLMLALSARQVAREGYLAYRLGFRLYVPGVTGKLLQIALWIVPHALVLPVIGWLLQRRQERSWKDAGSDIDSGAT
jgi:uncharacterized protein